MGRKLTVQRRANEGVPKQISVLTLHQYSSVERSIERGEEVRIGERGLKRRCPPLKIG
jgi:hypothetical protein